MKIEDLKKRLENLENQRVQTIANMGAVDGAMQVLRELIADEAKPAQGSGNVIPFPTVGASTESDVHQADVPVLEA